MSVLTLLSRLENIRRTGNGWSARCPAHDDRRNSLSISETPDGKVLIFCHAGCAPDQVLAALGLSWRDLHGKGEAPALTPCSRAVAGDPLTWLADYCAVPLDFVATLPLEAQGNAVAFGFSPLEVRKLREAGSKKIWWHPSGAPTPPLWPLPEAQLAPDIWLVEGETDCLAARYLGLPAYAITKGAGGTLTLEQAQALKARGVHRAYICFDVDDAGRQGGEKLAQVLSGAGIEAQVLDLAAGGVVDPLLGEKDVRDAWLRLRDRSALLQRLEAAALERGAEVGICTNNVYTQPVVGTITELSSNPFVRASDLQSQAAHQPQTWYPVLGVSGLVGPGLATLMSGRPKSGKSTLLAHACRDWLAEGLTVAWLTEEPRVKWIERLLDTPELRSERFYLAFPGPAPDEWLGHLRALHPQVIIIDTARVFLAIRDENDPVAVHAGLFPFITLARELEAALLVTHHRNKYAPAEEGLDHSGSHAYVGEVDIAISLLEVPEAPRRREVRVRSRWDSPSRLLLELGEDGTYRPLGEPGEVSQAEVEERVFSLMDEGWCTTAELWEGLAEPQPSKELVRRALLELWRRGAVEREPGRGSRPDRWRRTPRPTGQNCSNNRPGLYVVGTNDAGDTQNCSNNRPGLYVVGTNDADDSTVPTFSDNGGAVTIESSDGRPDGALPCISCGAPLPPGRKYLCYDCLPRGP